MKTIILGIVLFGALTTTSVLACEMEKKHSASNKSTDSSRSPAAQQAVASNVVVERVDHSAYYSERWTDKDNGTICYAIFASNNVTMSCVKK